MSFEKVSTKQLIKRHRELVDRLSTIRESLEPLLNDFEMVKTEFLEIEKELESRLGKDGDK